MGLLDYLWDWVYFLFYLPFGKKRRLVLIGLDNAGKTSTLTRLATGRMSNPLPTNHPSMFRDEERRGERNKDVKRKDIGVDGIG